MQAQARELRPRAAPAIFRPDGDLTERYAPQAREGAERARRQHAARVEGGHDAVGTKGEP